MPKLVAKITILSTSILSLFGSGTARAGNWFDGASSECISNLSTSIVSGGALDGLTAPTPRTSFAGTSGHFRLVYKLASSDLPNPKVYYQTVVVTLDKNATRDLATALKSAADKNPVLMFEDLSGFVLSIAPELVSYTWDAVYAAAKAVLAIEPVNVDAILPLLATGGEVTRDTVIQRSADNSLLAEIFWYYRVSVGSERRAVLLASCRMPVEVKFETALTHQDTNNKRIEFGGSTWAIYDIEDNKYDTPLHYKEQDKEWMYADELDANGVALNNYRISSKDIGGNGISWQTISGGKWRYLSKELSFE
ncbi:hypothetical protein [Rhizobium phaseoli]|uniref:hypothetical protein n=1 Tax=Rhizobium phaseoli TaxID=396 RepID=UPI0007EB0356|nr:hypothetical protein [Rhizobium phaseoli]